ncbi:hypothetical protein [Serratia phage PCH45]|uniref:hypothetical protein n=1 Tax=Serratia phage PCH45 TaxID=2608368 RepID=UPI0012A994F3|nr:hypothetical protein [Serratia phage PCH45]
MFVKWERGLYGIRPVIEFNIMQPDDQLTPAQRVIKKLHFDYNRRAFSFPLAGKITIKDLSETMAEYYSQPQWSNEWRGGQANAGTLPLAQG